MRPAFAVEVVASAATITIAPRATRNPFLAADAATPSSSPLTALTFAACGGAASPEGVASGSSRSLARGNRRPAASRGRRSDDVSYGVHCGQRPRARPSRPDEQRVIEEARARRLQRLARRELVSLRPLHRTPSSPSPRRWRCSSLPTGTPVSSRSLVLIGAYAAAFRLEFEVGSGSAVPTELILVPMLFLLPAGWVPLAVAAGIAARQLDRVRARDAAARAPRLAARRTPGMRSGPRSCSGSPARAALAWPSGRSTSAALAAQFALDFAVTAARQWITLGVPSRENHLRAMGSVYVIDAGLAPVGLAVAFAAQSLAVRRGARAAAGRPALDLRARAPGADRSRVRAPRRLPRHRLPARRRRRGRRRLHRRAQPRRGRARDACGRRARARPARAARPRVRGAAPRRRARSGSPTRSSTSPARSAPRSAR